MVQLFNNKYRIPSARLQNWNYANEAMYFVTICTNHRENYFGEIITNGLGGLDGLGVETQCIASLRATEIGKIAHSEWYKSVEMRPDMNLELGEFVVMPNHIHGIIIIGANEYNTITDERRGDAGGDERGDAGWGRRDVGWGRRDAGRGRRDAMHCVSTSGDTEYKNQFAPQSKNLASIIRGYKSAVTTYARKNGIEFDWQPRFYDHIIRSMDDYHKISNYIINNPAKWQEDKFYGQ